MRYIGCGYPFLPWAYFLAVVAHLTPMSPCGKDLHIVVSNRRLFEIRKLRRTDAHSTQHTTLETMFVITNRFAAYIQWWGIP